MALVGLGSVVVGLSVMLWGHDNESSAAGNNRHKISSRSRLASGAVASCQSNSPVPRLVVTTASSVLQSDEAAALGLMIDGKAEGAELVIGGFEAGSLFSVGQPVSHDAWSVPGSQIKTATIVPPRGFAGSMDIAVRLVLAQGQIADQGTLHLEWRPPRSASRPLTSSVLRQIDAAEVRALLARGNALEATGDLAGARLVLRRAAEAGNARAAFMVAETYDPFVLETLREAGLASNVATARVWYAKAKDLGSEEAPERLERLAHRSD